MFSHARAGHMAAAKPSQGKSCSRGWQKYVTHHPPEASASLLQASTASWYAMAFPYPGSVPSSPWQTQGRWALLGQGNIPPAGWCALSSCAKTRMSQSCGEMGCPHSVKSISAGLGRSRCDQMNDSLQRHWAMPLKPAILCCMKMQQVWDVQP